MTTAKEEFRSVVSLVESSYVRPKKLIGTKTELCPASTWIVSVDESTKDIALRTATKDESELSITNNPKDSTSKDGITNGSERVVTVQFKKNSGKPTGPTDIAMAVLYLYATRHCHQFNIRNIGTIGAPEYDVCKAKCQSGELSHQEKSFFKHIDSSQSVVIWEASSAKSLNIYAISTEY